MGNCFLYTVDVYIIIRNVFDCESYSTPYAENNPCNDVLYMYMS